NAHTSNWWSNSGQGQPAFNDGDGGASGVALLNTLHLRSYTGADFTFTSWSNYADWVHGPTNNNEAKVLSVELSAMELNVQKGFVSANAVLFAPDCNSANADGLVTVAALMAEADAALAADGTSYPGNSNYAYYSNLAEELNEANNGLFYVQSGSCSFSF
ncbi:MAG: hypothetical protein ACXWLM_11760, partial [Myxococcales bacterium]